MELMNARGVRDFPPEEKIIRQKIIDNLRRVFELYGFVPLETPIIERLDVLSAKYAGGAEILKETFQLSDQGGRDLCLRYDLTVPMCRFVGMNPNMKMPFKRYQIGRVYRDGPIKLGRYREFWQCDVDVVGTESMLADAQCVQIVQKFFKDVDMDVVVEINSRKILDGILEAVGIDQNKWISVILEIDKLKKTGIDSVMDSIEKLGVGEDQTIKLKSILCITGSNTEKIEMLKNFANNDNIKSGIEQIEELIGYLDESNAVFNIGLARGLSYYTDTVFEVFLTNEVIKKTDGEEITFSSSLCGGGRYNKIIGDYIGGGKEFPATGISFGIEPIIEVMKLLGKFEMNPSTTTVFIIPIQTQKECVKIAEQIRSAGINCDLDIMGRGISKNLGFANSNKIPYVVFAGPDEIKQNKVKLRDMVTGEEEMLSLKEVCEKLK